MKRYQIFLIVLLSCALANACGFINRGKLVASRYVTKTDAEIVLGVPLKLEREAANDSDARCVYISADENDFAELTVIIQSFSTKDELDFADESYRKIKADNGKVQTLGNIGDSAWISSSRNGRSQIIFVRKNNVGFHLIADGSDITEATSDKLKTLASRVAENL